MDLYLSLTLLFIGISFIGGYFLIRSIIRMSDEEIFFISASILGVNSTTANSYLKQKAEYTSGFILVIISNITQLGILLNQSYLINIYPTKDIHISIDSLIVILCLIYFIFNHITNKLYKKYKMKFYKHYGRG